MASKTLTPRTPKKGPKAPKAAGRPVRGATHRLELRRHKASTSVRVRDRHLALLHKVADDQEIPLSEALELVIDTAGQVLDVNVRADKRTVLGWA